MVKPDARIRHRNRLTKDVMDISIESDSGARDVFYMYVTDEDGKRMRFLLTEAKPHP